MTWSGDITAADGVLSPYEWLGVDPADFCIVGVVLNITDGTEEVTALAVAGATEAGIVEAVRATKGPMTLDIVELVSQRTPPNLPNLGPPLHTIAGFLHNAVGQVHAVLRLPALDERNVVFKVTDRIPIVDGPDPGPPGKPMRHLRAA